jgi:hypothetical protein
MPPVLLLAAGVGEAAGAAEVGATVAGFEVAGTGAAVLVVGAAVAAGWVTAGWVMVGEAEPHPVTMKALTKRIARGTISFFTDTSLCRLSYARGIAHELSGNLEVYSGRNGLSIA